MLRLANLVVYSPRGIPSLLDLSVTVKVSCSIVSFSGGSTHGRPWAVGQEHPISGGHKAAEGLHGSGTFWVVPPMPHLSVGQSLCKCMAETSACPSPPNNHTVQCLIAFITLNASERGRADYSAHN